jgi:cyclophilin family peptidyl-prolyl cis-trans isomerase
MNFKLFLTSLLFLTITCGSCTSQKKIKEPIVVITTEFGNIKLKLYNETPLHRDNFIKLIKNGYFNEKIFHRVIKNFMIQGGNSPDQASQTQQNLGYTIPAEIIPGLYHKKGALAAARKGDEVNPNRESTPNQFYIVQGEKFSTEQLKQIEESINNQFIQDLAKKFYFEEHKKSEQNKTPFDQQTVINAVIEKAKKENTLHPFSYTQTQINTYTTIGGTPHLDGTYTVFGEVIEGLDVIDKIAQVKTLPGDKPEKDVKFSIKLNE